MATRGTNRLTRDNAGRITGTGNGATARGGRLKTASGAQRGKVMAKGPKRLAKPGTIRESDVRFARSQNTLSKNIEKRQKAGKTNALVAPDGWIRPAENATKRLQRAQDRIAKQARKPATKPMSVKPARARARKAKTADDLLTQATRIEMRGRRMSRAARTGARDRQIESRAVRAARAARAKAFEMQKPKPESKTAKMKRERAARVKAREQATNASRLIQAARRRRS